VLSQFVCITAVSHLYGHPLCELFEPCIVIHNHASLS